MFRSPRKLFQKNPPVVPSQVNYSLVLVGEGVIRDKAKAGEVNRTQIVQGHPEVRSLSTGHHCHWKDFRRFTLLDVVVFSKVCSGNPGSIRYLTGKVSESQVSLGCDRLASLLKIHYHLDKHKKSHSQPCLTLRSLTEPKSCPIPQNTAESSVLGSEICRGCTSMVGHCLACMRETLGSVPSSPKKE